MMKKVIFLVLCLLSASCFAANLSNCGLSLPANNPDFCASFKSVAECNCVSRGIPRAFCNNMNTLYRRMITIFGSLERACKFQKETDQQTCIDQWTCYRNGGKDSHGHQCAATGNACQ